MDSPEPGPEIDLSGIEGDLRRLKPGPIKIERDRLLFEAGRASQRAEHRGRLASILGLAGFVAAIGFGGLFASEHARRVDLEVRLAEKETSSVPPRMVVETRSLPPEPNSYLILRRNLLVGLSEPRSPGPVEKDEGSSPGDIHPLSQPLRARGSNGLIPL
jgi:hypothetical protein